MKRILPGVLLLLAVLFFVPIAMTFLLSFRRGAVGYWDLFFDCFIFYRMFWNSLGYTLVIAAVQLLIALPAAISLYYLRGKWKTALFYIYVILMIMPLQVTLLPNYIGLRDMGLLNTPWAILLPQFFSPFAVGVLYQYIRNWDDTLVQACRLETNSFLQAFFHGMLPQLKGCIAAVFLFGFAESWNMVEQPMLFVKDSDLKTLSVFLAEADRYQGELLFPASVVYLIPVLLLFGFFGGSYEK